MRGRPLLYTSYPHEMRLLPTTTKRVAMALFLVVLLLLPLKALPLAGFLGDSDWLILIDRALVFAIAALGLANAYRAWFLFLAIATAVYALGSRDAFSFQLRARGADRESAARVSRELGQELQTIVKSVYSWQDGKVSSLVFPRLLFQPSSNKGRKWFG